MTHGTWNTSLCFKCFCHANGVAKQWCNSCCGAAFRHMNRISMQTAVFENHSTSKCHHIVFFVIAVGGVHVCCCAWLSELHLGSCRSCDNDTVPIFLCVMQLHDRGQNLGTVPNLWLFGDVFSEVAAMNLQHDAVDLCGSEHKATNVRTE